MAESRAKAGAATFAALPSSLCRRTHASASLLADGRHAGRHAPPQPDTATLRVGTREIIVFGGALGAAGAGERAATAARRIAGAIESGADSVSTQRMPEGVLVLLGGRPLFVVTESDADSAGGESVEARAAAAVSELRLAVAEVHESRSVKAILLALAMTLAATLVLVLAIRLLLAGHRRLDARLERAAATERRFRARGLRLLRPATLLAAARVGLRMLAWALGITLGYLYLTFVLTRFPWTRPAGQVLGHYLVSTLARLGLGALGALPGLLTVGVILLVARLFVRLVRSVFQSVERGVVSLPGLHPATAEPTRRIVTALIWLFALVMVYPFLPGSQSAAFKGVSVFGGLLVTLGSAGLVGQAMSGLVLMYSRGFKVGDFVQIGQVQGTIVWSGLLSTRLRTTKNEYVTMPNNVVVGGPVTNFSVPREQGHALTIYSSVTIGYDVPWRTVHQLMIEAARATEGVVAQPEPYVLQRGLNDWYVEYQVNAAIDPGRAAELPAFYSRLHGSIQDAFWAAGIEILSPSYFALRDGNVATIPSEHRPKTRATTFRVDVDPSP